MARTLRDSVVIITGASAGIGQALARQLHGEGCRLTLAARRIDKLEELNHTLGGGHLCLQIDVSRPDDCKMLIDETIDQFGRVDTLVCNAGYGLVRRADEMSQEELEQLFATNVYGTLHPMRHAVPHLQRNDVRDGWRGQVMIVSSAAARRGLPFFGAYSATKAAQLSLAEAARVELADQRIAVTSVHPIGTTTEFFTAAETLSNRAIVTPGRTAYRQTAEQVANAMVKAMKRPRPEVWPAFGSRLGLALASLMPRFADRIMRRSYLEIVERHKQGR